MRLELVKLKRKDIQLHIKDVTWQTIREDMKGKSLERKIRTLRNWLEENNSNYKSKIQIINYINALKRSSYSKPLKKIFKGNIINL